MLISMNWIGEFVDLSGIDKDALIGRFTLSTAEVEEIYHMGSDIKRVVAAKIISVEKHPDSKKLHLLKVDAGDKIYDVVCGAPNVREGMIVPLATEGGRVGDMEIRCAKIAGFESHGMCCSEHELGISADHSGLMEITDDVKLGTDITKLYDIVDTVFEVDNKSLTNRPDLWGHYGIAREFAALTGKELKPLETLDLSSFSALPSVQIEVLDELCLRYTGIKVHNVKRKISPVNMRIRLFYCGTRAINLLADLTNYLMLEMGQPMHAFDCAKVDCIEVKRYEKPFEFTTLDGTVRNIDENTLMICSKGEPVAVAGIMGGLDSEIEDSTDSLLLESANFDAVSVRKSSTRLGLRTDASMRYEKTLDPEMTVTAAARFMKLLTELDPGAEIISSLTDVYVKKYPEISLSFDKAYIDRYTGIDIENEQILKTLRSLGFSAELSDGLFKVRVPSWRSTKDVTITADIIEEITRIYGYDNFKITTTNSALYPEKRSPGNLADNLAKDILVRRFGLHEVHSYIWCDSKKYRALNIATEPNVKLLNAMTPENDTLRNCMVPTLLSFVHENRSYADDFGIFEIGRVVCGKKPNGECLEKKKLGVVLFSKTKTEKELFFKLLSLLSSVIFDEKHVEPVFANIKPEHGFAHPKNTAGVSAAEKLLGFACTLHPDVLEAVDKKAVVAACEIDMDELAALPYKNIEYAELSKFPGIFIDLSLSIGNATRFDELKPAWADAGELLKKVRIIDEFVNAGQKSVTIRFDFSSDSKTLSKEELQPVTDKIVSELAKRGIQLKK